MKNKEKVTITKEQYEELINDQKILRALEGGGVDNWEGYDFALDAIWGALCSKAV